MIEKTLGTFRIQDRSIFRRQLWQFAKGYEVFALLDSNDFYDRRKDNHPYYHSYDLVAGIGARRVLALPASRAFDGLQEFHTANPTWLLGYLSYDLKEETDGEPSPNEDHLQFPSLFFFEPEILLLLKGNELAILCPHGTTPEDIYRNICNMPSADPAGDASTPPFMRARIPQQEYLEKVERIRQHIEEGDVYELNFCQEFYSENTPIDPFRIYASLSDISPQPFSAFIRNRSHYILSASMERYLKKEGKKLISQPIKGTIRRGKTETEDLALAKELLNDPKERAENVMIVDLVRNDLSRTCRPGTVKVEELFGIYAFPQVFQMISTVTGELQEECSGWDAIKKSFPMGSMTGAPKEMAMELADKYENSRRGVYSGAIGYITPEGDMDFSVVIRTILYNEVKKYLSIYVGSAITYDSIPQKEYEECLVKIKGLLQALGATGVDGL